MSHKPQPGAAGLAAALPEFFSGAAAPPFVREPLARFGCCHCGHVGDYPATPAPLPCPKCGQPLQALPIAPKG